jgi:predicted RNase H-related nuclease YkuK (DUF458 family)
VATKYTVHISQEKADDEVLATTVQQVKPTQQDLVAEDMAAQEEAQHVHPAQQEEDLEVHAETEAGTIIDLEEDALTAEVAEAILAAVDSHEYKHVDEQDAVPAEIVKINVYSPGMQTILQVGVT